MTSKSTGGNFKKMFSSGTTNELIHVQSHNLENDIYLKEITNYINIITSKITTKLNKKITDTISTEELMSFLDSCLEVNII